jgi:hypothetical protein
MAHGYRRRFSPRRMPLGKDLSPFELRVMSQNGEDGVVAEIGKRIGFPSRTFVEFGAETGAEGNCAILADAFGWAGLFIEADENKYTRLAARHRGNARVVTLQSSVTSSNINRLLTSASVPPEVDILSVDVDGNDYWIWKALTATRPRLVIVEYNAAHDPKATLVQPDDDTSTWDGTDFFGASLGALRALGDLKGYRLVYTDLAGVNAFFVRADLAADAFLDPDAVAVRSPNYFLTGTGHPPHAEGRTYIDLTSAGEQ